MIILESTIVFSHKRQNRYITLYGAVSFSGMLILLLLFDGVSYHKGYPTWNLFFFIYVVFISAVFAVYPFLRTSVKIYLKFETKELKRKWFYYLIGSVGVISVGYMAFVNLVLDNPIFRLVFIIYGPTNMFWGYLIYHGIGIKLRDDDSST
jgi:hypothetical protein